jgi:2-oxoglutarate ferredoxin oxidoreductase subunit gamma
MSVEREVMLTGIGGQGVQLGAQILARATTLEEREVMLLGTYGGTMRGGPTDSTLIVADQPIAAPPIVARTWSALAMHHAFWEPLRRKLRPRAVVVLNASLFSGDVDRDEHRVFEVPATALASELGSALAGSLVLVSAFAALTGLVGIEALVSAMRDSVPPYRHQHVELNERALRAGFDSVPWNVAPAWSEEERAA